MEDLTPKADTVRAAAREWIRKLQLGGAQPDSESLHKLESLVERAENFRKRWQDLRGLLQEEHRSYANARRTLELRDQAVLEAKGSSRLRIEEHWNDRFDLVVRILEKNAAPLLEDDPTWLPREIAAIEAAWDQLKVMVEKEAQVLADLRAKSKDTDSEMATTKGADTTSGGSPDDPPGAIPEVDPTATALDSPELARMARDIAEGTNPRRTVVESANPVSEARTRSPTSVPRRPSAPASNDNPDSGFFWAVVGFLAATVLFAVGSRLRRRDPRD